MGYLPQAFLSVMSLLNLNLPQKDCLSPEALYQQMKPSVVKLEIQTPKYKASGSGVLIDNQGTVITSTHVIDDAVVITVVDSASGARYAYQKARLGDPNSVSSVKPVKEHPVAFRTLSEPLLNPGENLYFVGYPFEYDGLFSAGHYMGTTTHENRTYLLTNALLNPGNSGGPAFTCEGEIAGFVLGADTRGASAIGILNHYQDAAEVLSDAR
jgi:S1-C subfamily serine protease